MKVKRIVANVAAADLAAVRSFYGDVLGLDLLMDLGFFVTYGSPERMQVQVGAATEGGSGTPVPDISIEVDDLDGRPFERRVVAQRLRSPSRSRKRKKHANS